MDGWNEDRNKTKLKTKLDFEKAGGVKIHGVLCSSTNLDPTATSLKLELPLSHRCDKLNIFLSRFLDGYLL